MQEINQEKILEALNNLKEQRVKLDAVIQPFFSDKLNTKQRIELDQVGKFLTLLDQPSSIEVHNDSPDFIIKYNGERVGLEHERIFKAGKVEVIKSVTKLFTDTEHVFKANYPNLSVLAKIWLNTDNFSFKKSDTNRLKNEISYYIFCLLTNNLLVEKPSYIDRVSLKKFSQVAFCYNPGGYMASNLDVQELEKAIQKKDLLVNKYKLKSGLNRQWLLIVIGSPSPDSFEFGDNPFHVALETNFERVYLMEDLNAKIWQIL